MENFAFISTVTELNHYLYHRLSNSNDLENGIKNFVLYAKSLADNYFLFSPIDKTELGDGIIGACHVVNWGIAHSEQLKDPLASSSVSNFVQPLDQFHLTELEKKLPKEILQIRDMAWPLDYPADTDKEKLEQDDLWRTISQIIDLLFEKYLSAEERALYFKTIERIKTPE